MKFKYARSVLTTIACSLMGVAGAATKSEWTFHHEPGAIATNRYVLQVLKSNDSRAQLWSNDDGTFEFRLLGAGADECWSRARPATVERTEIATTITPEGLYATCPKIRLVIRFATTAAAERPSSCREPSETSSG